MFFCLHACHRRHLSQPTAHRAARHGDASHQRPPARIPLQHPHPAHRRSTLRRSLRRHRRRRHRGAEPRRRPRHVCRKRRPRPRGIARQPHCTQNPRGTSNWSSAACRSPSAISPAATRVSPSSISTRPGKTLAAYTQSLNLLAESSAALLAPEALVIAEHARRGSVTPSDTYGTLHRYRLLEQGDAALSFYRQQSVTETAAD